MSKLTFREITGVNLTSLGYPTAKTNQGGENPIKILEGKDHMRVFLDFLILVQTIHILYVKYTNTTRGRNNKTYNNIRNEMYEKKLIIQHGSDS